MKPHPRIRKTIKWGGAAVTALLVVTYIFSNWWYVAWADPAKRYWVSFGRGQLYIRYDPDEFGKRSGPTGWCFGETIGGYFGMWFGAESVGPRHWTFRAPVWPLIAALVIVSTLAWRTDALYIRRSRLNLCPECNYDRAGIAADAKCPECGAIPKDA